MASLPVDTSAIDGKAAEALGRRIEQVRDELMTQRDELSLAIRQQPRGIDPNDDDALRHLIDRVEDLRNADRFRSGRL